MTNVTIDPGVCGLTTNIEAVSEDGMEVVLTVDSNCPYVTGMFDELGTTFDAFEVVFGQPGNGVFYEYASANFPHRACVSVAGIVKAIEAECKLALPVSASVTFNS